MNSFQTYLTPCWWRNQQQHEGLENAVSTLFLSLSLFLPPSLPSRIPCAGRSYHVRILGYKLFFFPSILTNLLINSNVSTAIWDSELRRGGEIRTAALALHKLLSVAWYFIFLFFLVGKIVRTKTRIKVVSPYEKLSSSSWWKDDLIPFFSLLLPFMITLSCEFSAGNHAYKNTHIPPCIKQIISNVMLQAEWKDHSSYWFSRFARCQPRRSVLKCLRSQSSPKGRQTRQVKSRDRSSLPSLTSRLTRTQQPPPRTSRMMPASQRQDHRQQWVSRLTWPRSRRKRRQQQRSGMGVRRGAKDGITPRGWVTTCSACPRSSQGPVIISWDRSQQQHHLSSYLPVISSVTLILMSGCVDPAGSGPWFLPMMMKAGHLIASSAAGIVTSEISCNSNTRGRMPLPFQHHHLSHPWIQLSQRQPLHLLLPSIPV